MVTVTSTVAVENQPLLLNVSNTALRVTPEQFDRLCIDNPDLRLELTPDRDQLSLDFHIDSIFELLRICSEVRIFPLLKLNGEPSSYLDSVVQQLCSKGFKIQIQTVAYEFQKCGNQMLKITT